MKDARNEGGGEVRFVANEVQVFEARVVLQRTLCLIILGQKQLS